MRVVAAWTMLRDPLKGLLGRETLQTCAALPCLHAAHRTDVMTSARTGTDENFILGFFTPTSGRIGQVEKTVNQMVDENKQWAVVCHAHTHHHDCGTRVCTLVHIGPCADAGGDAR